jgi:hypothetical protein
MIRVIVAAVLGTIVMFAFGGWFWLMSPYPGMMIVAPKDEDALVEQLKKSCPESGAYYFPFADQETMANKESEAGKAFQRKHEAGPLGQVVIQYQGVKMMDPMVMGQGVGHYFVSAILMGLLLKLALPGLGGYVPRVAFVTIAGVFASVSNTLAQPVWLHHPWKTPLYFAAFYAVSWLLAGIVMAIVIRPTR